MSDSNKFAAHFDEMAERVRRILPEEFAGAILVVPAEGEPIALAMADTSKDQEVFWSSVMGKVSVRCEELRNAKSPGGAGYGRR